MGRRAGGLGGCPLGCHGNGVLTVKSRTQEFLAARLAGHHCQYMLTCLGSPDTAQKRKVQKVQRELESLFMKPP